MSGRLLSLLMPMHAAAAARASSQMRQVANDSVLSCLRGHPELLTIALVDRDLAFGLKALVDLCEEADFSEAQSAAEAVAHRLRLLTLETRCDDAGLRK